MNAALIKPLIDHLDTMKQQRDDALKVCAEQAEQIRVLKTRIAELLDMPAKRTTLPQDDSTKMYSNYGQPFVLDDPDRSQGHCERMQAIRDDIKRRGWALFEDLTVHRHARAGDCFVGRMSK